MDYEALRFIWWVLIGVLLIGFVVTDGFDMGVAALLKIVGKSNDERRVMINSIFLYYAFHSSCVGYDAHGPGGDALQPGIHRTAADNAVSPMAPGEVDHFADHIPLADGDGQLQAAFVEEAQSFATDPLLTDPQFVEDKQSGNVRVVLQRWIGGAKGLLVHPHDRVGEIRHQRRLQALLVRLLEFRLVPFVIGVRSVDLYRYARGG